MQYIILDLEWNQPMSYESAVYKQVGDRLIFEMIQIGAVKLDEKLNMVDSISIPICPTHYVKIHPRIRKMTQLGPEELADAPTFLPAMEQFAAWCGEDYTLLTWGCDDVSVLKQNMDFFGCQVHLPPLCDIQRLFSDVYKCKDRKGLKAAMEMLQIEPEEERSFHNALNDAYYTALVFAHMPDPAAVLKYPQQPKQLIHAQHHSRRRIKGETYDSLAQALASQEAQQPRCPTCGKRIPLEDAYVKQCAGKYIALGKCPHHGPMMIRLNLHATADGRCAMGMTIAKATVMNRAYVHTKKLQVQQQEARYLETHASLPDPEQELLQAERTSMPFDD